MQLKVRRQGAVRATSALIVVEGNAEGYREIPGVRIANAETEQGWLETFRWLKSRGLEGVDLMVSDAHEGLDRVLEADTPVQPYDNGPSCRLVGEPEPQRAEHL